MTRGGLLSLLLATCVLPMSIARAAPPCFPERTVLKPTKLIDEHTSEVIAYLRNGAMVRIVDDTDFESPVVEVQGFDLRGKVANADLRVFARLDLEVLKDFAWLRKGHPLRIVADKGAGTVEVDTAEQTLFKLPAAVVRCDEIASEFKPDRELLLYPTECWGAMVGDANPPEGQQIGVVRDKAVLEDASGTNRIVLKFFSPAAGLIEKRKDRVFLEVVTDGHKIRGWTDESAFVLEEVGGWSTSSPCLDGHWTDKGTSARALKGATLRTQKGQMIFELTQELVVRTVTKATERTEILVGFPSFDYRNAQVILVGWVDNASVVTKKSKPRTKKHGR